MTATATTLTVAVTQEHIDRGKPGWCSQCPLALAIRAAIPGAELTTVFFTDRSAAASVWFSDADGTSFALPKEAEAFVAAFDAGLDVSPFTFTVEAVAP